MHRRDGGDQRHVRPGQPRQRRDLARRVHADLDHREVGVRRHPRQRQRHAPVVVEALLGRVHACPARPSASAQHLLGCRSCRPSRSPPRPGPPKRARAAAPSARSAAEHVGHHQQRRVRRHALGPRATPAPPRRRAPAPRRRTRGRPARPSAPRRDRPARSARVSIDTPDAAQSRGPAPPVAAAASPRSRARSRPRSLRLALSRCAGARGARAGERRRGGAAPASRRPRAGRHAPSPSSAATATLACSTSSKGRTSCADDLPGLVALAGDQQRVARLQRVDRGQDRLGAVADLGRLGRAGRAPPRGWRRGPRCAGCRR